VSVTMQVEIPSAIAPTMRRVRPGVRLKLFMASRK